MSQQANLKITNANLAFRDAMVANKVCTIRPHQKLVTTAPAGTRVYAASSMFRNHAKGSILAQVETGSHTLAAD